MEFEMEALRAWCATGIYEEVCAEEVKEIVQAGRMVSSTFTVWQGDGLERKGRFVINFARQSRHLPQGSVKMEILTKVSLILVTNDYLMSWDIKSGYRHVYLYPLMRDFFIFHSGSRYFRYIALLFGCSRSVL
jgi:hypothetical protein